MLIGLPRERISHTIASIENASPRVATNLARYTVPLKLFWLKAKPCSEVLGWLHPAAYKSWDDNRRMQMSYVTLLPFVPCILLHWIATSMGEAKLYRPGTGKYLEIIIALQYKKYCLKRLVYVSVFRSCSSMICASLVKAYSAMAVH